MRYHIACDASVVSFQGLGWAIIHNLDTGVIRHKAIARRLVKANASSLMELQTVYAVFLSLPNDCEVELVNDCQMMHDIFFWESTNWLNSRKIFSTEAQELKAVYDLAKRKGINFAVKGKTTHHWHNECDKNCHRFREELHRNGKMVHLFTLTPEYKARFVSTHYNLIKAQEAANQLGRRQRAHEETKTPVIYVCARHVEGLNTVKDNKGRVYEVVK